MRSGSVSTVTNFRQTSLTGVVHHSVLDGDVTHHQTQAVQLELQLVIRHARGCQGVLKLLSEKWLRWVWSSGARRVTLCSVTSRPSILFRILLWRSSTTAFLPKMARSLHRKVSFTSGNKLDGHFLTGGDSHRL